MERKSKKVNVPLIVSTVIFLCGILGMGLYIYSINNEEASFKEIRKKKNNKSLNIEKDDSLNYYLINDEVVQEEFKDLYLENSDIIGWIKIDDTPIDYPVMYTPEEYQFYLHKDFNKEYSFGGCIFAGEGTDIERPDENIVIYGHHMANKSMFHELDGYADKEYYKEHKYIKFDTLRQTGTYEVIAAFKTQIYRENYEGFIYYNYTNMNKESFEEYIDNIKNLSEYETDSSAKYGDQLITLSTCAYHTYNGRFVVVAKRIDGKEVDIEKEPIKIIKTTK